MKRALLIIDVQLDFLPGGALAVPEGDAILPFVLRLLQGRTDYQLVVITQDWHPPDHGSFADSHEGVEAFELGELGGVPQVFWPVHCVAKTSGARLAPDVAARVTELEAAGQAVHMVRKGQNRTVDSYSAFFDNARRHDTGLKEVLMAQGITAVDIVGLALDYCVRYSALDAAALGFQTRVLLPGCRAVDPASVAGVVEELAEKGIACVAH